MHKVIHLFTIISLLGFSSFLTPQENSGSLARYLPNVGDSDGWNLFFTPEEAEGDDLFLLIDGGAELYHEYGFKRALAVEYSGPGGRKINIEMYRMSDPFSAYGIFSFKAGAKGEELNIGNGAVLEDYYLNFFKSDIQVSITALDSSPGIRQDLIRFAETISMKIGESEVNLPGIVTLLPEGGEDFHFIKYIKGYLALMNNIDFGLGDIFKIREGVIGRWGNTMGIVLKYPDSSDAGHWFVSSGETFKTSDRYQWFYRNECGYSVINEKGSLIMVEIKSTCLIILIGNSKMDIERIKYQIEERIEEQNYCVND